MLYIAVPEITNIYPVQQGSSFLNISWTVDNPLGLESNGTRFTVMETTGNSEEVFTSNLVASGSNHQCFSGLQSDTLYTISIVIVYACENTMLSEVISTAVGSVDDVIPPDECLEYLPIRSMLLLLYY